jgi:nucleoside-diphosphate-sugar epimerase
MLIYASTSGVYGNRDGQWVAETDATQPETPRAHRRADAEQQVRWWGRALHNRVSILRVPGIYAPDREGGTPLARLHKATPVLCAEDDVYTNHIHANDLARAALLALWRARPQRIYNISDDSQMKMGDYFDWAADHYGLPRPPRVARADAAQQLPAMMLSFMQESRRLHNDRMKKELGLRLWYPTVQHGLA